MRCFQLIAATVIRLGMCLVSQTSYAANAFAPTQGVVNRGSAWLPSWVSEVLEVETAVTVDQLSEELVREMYLGLSSGNSPHQKVVDPQGFLGKKERESCAKTLEKHSQESALPMFLYLFGSGQESLGLSPKEVYEAKLAPRPAMVIFYFYGDARSALGYVHGGKDGEAAPYDVAELLRKSGRKASGLDAGHSVMPFAELVVFSKEVSQRLFWIEHKLIQPKIDVEDAASTRGAVEDMSTLDKLGAFFEELRSDPDAGRVWYSIFGIFLLCLALIGRFIYRRKRNYIFPDSGIGARLGAKNGAEVSELIEFVDVKASLDDQKRELKENDL